jgi:hypothetical protein
MTEPVEAQQKADRLHAEEDAEKAISERLPPGDARDEHRMRGERLSDQAWKIEEAEDIAAKPSGLWPSADKPTSS